MKKLQVSNPQMLRTRVEQGCHVAAPSTLFSDVLPLHDSLICNISLQSGFGAQPQSLMYYYTVHNTLLNIHIYNILKLQKSTKAFQYQGKVHNKKRNHFFDVVF